MLKNYLKTAFRNLWKNRTFSFINIFGLSVGIAAFLLIVNYLRFEYSFDDANDKKDRIYRIPMAISEKGGKEQTFAFTYPAVAPALLQDFPEMEAVARLRRRGGIVKHGDQKIVENGTVYYVDSSLFHIFTFDFLKGNAAAVFHDLNDAVITRSTALRYFGNEEPVGQALNYGNEDYIVKAVLADPPANSHLQFNILLNYNKYNQLTDGAANSSWNWSDFYTYALLKPGTDPTALAAKLPGFAERYLGQKMQSTGFRIDFRLQRLKDIHLRSSYDYELAGNGNLTYLKYLGIAALFILFIAWINYVNLSTARSLERAKEVGVRKVVGAGKFQLIRQFLSEAFLLNCLAIILGVVIFQLTLSPFAQLVGQDMHDLNLGGWGFWMTTILLFLVGTLVAGFYPAFVLSSFQPIQSIKGAQGFNSGRPGRTLLRRMLVVVQFVAAIVLIAGALGFYRQLRFMQHRDLGVNIRQTLILQQNADQDSADIPAFQAFVNEMESHPGIESVTASTSVPGGEVGGSSAFTVQGSNAEKRCRVFGIDKKFIPAYGLTVVEGRNFSTDRPAVDTNSTVSVILNETAVKVFGFNRPADAIGRQLNGGGTKCRVVGVLKDYHQESLQYDFDPIVFYPEEERQFSNFSLKVNTADLPALITFIKKKWTEYFPESPYSFSFLDDRFNAQYNQDRLFATVLWLFTIVAIIIACLGLFGLSLYTVAKRTKEISIRKVLGASLIQITTLITRDYLKLVMIAGLLALPLAFFIVTNWLDKYAFRISLGLWFFLLPVAMIVVIAVVTVLYQSFKAALANPVRSLRSE